MFYLIFSNLPGFPQLNAAICLSDSNRRDHGGALLALKGARFHVQRNQPGTDGSCIQEKIITAIISVIHDNGRVEFHTIAPSTYI